MASQKISQLTAITTLASGDYLPVVQASDTSNKRVGVGVLDVRYTAAASGVAAQSTANAALSSGNAALTVLPNKYDKTGGPISGPVITQSQTIGSSVFIRASGTITLNLATSNNFEIVLTSGTQTLASPVNASGGQTGVIVVRQDGTGSRLLSYNNVWAFPNNVAPTLTTSASGVDLLVYYVSNASRINTVATLGYGSGIVG